MTSAFDEAAVRRWLTDYLVANNGCSPEQIARGASMHDLGVPFARRLEILCDVAAQLWRPAPHCGLPTGADKGRRGGYLPGAGCLEYSNSRRRIDALSFT